ncbi:MAG: hypothetical protein JKY22_07820 [Flavobacteriaceae bacterium]|nr:hypothetical protein [Flavobacteriaceae bacterium]
MKKFLFLLFLLFNFFGVAQSGPIDVPTIFPSSPEASKLGKYGDIPVDLSLGATQFTIPIYTIKEYGAEFPIYLSYAYSGLVVGEVPGNTGLGWSLMAGGTLTRQVRGRPDEDYNGYIGDQEIGKNYVIPYIEHTISTADELQLFEFGNNGVYDTQPDKFIASVGSMYVSFYFNENKEVVIHPYKPYKVEPLSADFELGFKITDDNGIEYYFQETETSKRVEYNLISDALATPVNGYNSSWKISQIILPNGRTVDFDYSLYEYTTKYITQSKQKLIQGIGNCNNNIFTPPKLAVYKLKTKLLDKITFTEGEVHFINSTILATGYNNYWATLDRIEVRNNFGTIINKYDLTFDDETKTRKLLTQVIVNDNTNFSYSFEYIGIPEDEIAFYKQDFWGFYNNGTSTNFINLDDFYTGRAPNFNHAKIGALQKITYPTKGFTELEYEANTYDPGKNGDEYDDFYTNENSPCSVFNATYTAFATVTYPTGGGVQTAYDDVIFTIDEDTAANIYLEATKASITGHVTTKLERINPSSGIVACQDPNLLECQPNFSCTTATVQFGGGVNPPNNIHYDFFSKKVYLKVGTYKLSVDISQAFVDETNRTINGLAYVNLNADGTIPPQVRSRETGGIRIAKVTSCPNGINDDDCLIKEYAYEDATGISQGFLFRRRNLFKHQVSYIFTSAGNYCVFDMYSSSSNAPLAIYNGSHVVYKQVIEKQVDQLGNSIGNKVLDFKTLGVIPYVFPYIDINNNEYRNGKLLKETIYDDSQLKVLEKTFTHDFNENLNLPPTGIAYGMKTAVSVFNFWLGLPVSPGISDYQVGLSYFDNRNSVDLLAGINEKEWRNSNVIENAISYQYTNPNGHLSQDEKIDSDGAIYKTEYIYPYDLNTGVYIDLVTANRLSSPSEIKSFKNGSLLVTQKTVYDNWSTGIIEPEYVQTAKASNSLEDRLRYHDYDNYGNLLDVSKQNGTRISYIWGYNSTLPLAKIENVLYSQIPTSTINNLKNLSNLDDDDCYAGASCDENNLRNALNNLRAQFPEAMITTYTYNPLVGPTSITDPKGYTAYYIYDNQNRLEYIMDQDGKIVEKTEYNLKN